MCSGNFSLVSLVWSSSESFLVSSLISLSFPIIVSNFSRASTICSSSPFSGSRIFAICQRESLEVFSNETALINLFPLISSTAFEMFSLSLESSAYFAAMFGLWSGDPFVISAIFDNLFKTVSTSPTKASCSVYCSWIEISSDLLGLPGTKLDDAKVIAS